MISSEFELVTYSKDDDKIKSEDNYQVETTIFISADTKEFYSSKSKTTPSQRISKSGNVKLLHVKGINQDRIIGSKTSIEETIWKPLKSLEDSSWVKNHQTEEEKWLTNLQVPNEWIPKHAKGRSISKQNFGSKLSIKCIESRASKSYLSKRHQNLKGTMTHGSRHGSGFTSYIDLEAQSDQKESEMDILPNLLPGEMLISQADRVCVYSTHAGGMTSGQTGTLFVTTLKLSLKLHVEKDIAPTKNKLVDELDIPLSCIQSVYEIWGDNGEKKKKLPMWSNVSNKINGLFIQCKNFRFLRFSFKFSGVETGRNVTNALLHHSRPKKNELLFAFEHCHSESLHNQYSTNWEKIRRNSECPNTRLSRANETWQVSISLPQQFVVPTHVTDEFLSHISGMCSGTRPPVWVWGNKIGGSIYVQPVLNVSPSQNVDSLFEDFFNTKKKIILDAEALMPSSTILEESFISMLDLHCIDGEREAEEKDKSYWSNLESTGWISTVGLVLKLAHQVAENVTLGKTVIIKEGEGRSSSILISSIAQIILCEDYRTRSGFESLIQSNWVSLGFPFSRNHTLSNLSSKITNLNPTFLLFLDCVHQISHQFPSKFEFLPQYLINIWDTALLPIFDTFIFNSEHDRAVARSNSETPLKLQSAWDWEQQFSAKQVSDWDNPLYGIPLRPPRFSSTEPSEFSMIMGQKTSPVYPESKKILNVSGEIVNLSVWHQLFHRSVPFLKMDNSWIEELMELRKNAKTSITNNMNTTVRSVENKHKNNHKESKSKPYR